jgi:hypothetical protein
MVIFDRLPLNYKLNLLSDAWRPSFLMGRYVVIARLSGAPQHAWWNAARVRDLRLEGTVRGIAGVLGISAASFPPRSAVRGRDGQCRVGFLAGSDTNALRRARLQERITSFSGAAVRTKQRDTDVGVWGWKTALTQYAILQRKDAKRNLKLVPNYPLTQII